MQEGPTPFDIVNAHSCHDRGPTICFASYRKYAPWQSLFTPDAAIQDCMARSGARVAASKNFGAWL